jgi:hypothetical protein
MTHNWKTGDVALRTGRDGSTTISLVTRQGVGIDAQSNSHQIWRHANGRWNELGEDEKYGTYRPLLVIDPEDREQIERLTMAIFAEVGGDLPDGYTANEVQAAIRSLLEPEPEEPTGLGAVVRAGDDSAWVRIPQHNYNNWRRADAAGMGGYWRNIPRPITVLSEGWQEATDE